MADELTQIKPSEVHFVEELRRSERGAIFRVMVRGRHCAMKVYHYLAPSPNDPPNRDINIFRCETNAYRRLKAKGFCKRGVIPDFYGVIEWIEPREWRPHLDIFLDDSGPPSAVLIEYVADMHQIDLSTFSKNRLTSFRTILREFHEARVFHGDADPRHMMVVSGKPDRVLWIDFDSAQTLPENKPPTKWQQEWMELEIQRMDYFVYGLAQDYAEGKLNKVWNYYYDSVKDEACERDGDMPNGWQE